MLQLDNLSTIRLFIPKDLVPLEKREHTIKQALEVISRFEKDGVPFLDPEEDMKVRNIRLYLRFVLMSVFFCFFLCLLGCLNLFLYRCNQSHTNKQSEG